MAEDKNWASFPSDNRTNEDDDDWADFGGFETAQPITDPQTSTSTGLISWAAVTPTPQAASNTTAGTSQPLGDFHDKLQQQNPWAGSILPTQLSPSQQTSIEEQTTDYSKELKAQEEKTEKAEHLVSELENKLAVVEQEKSHFKQNLEDLINKNQLLEEASNTTEQRLEEQKLRYSKLQAEHQTQISDIRQAGHDALALIMEEYKELCKQAVLEQKEKSLAELKLFLENEQQKLKETLVQQQESFEKTISEERTTNDDRIKSVLQAEQEKQKLLLQSSLKAEQEESKMAMESAIKATIEQVQESFKEAVNKERESHQKAMEKMEKLLQEEREKFKLSLEEAINDERKQSKIAIQEALEEERRRSRDALSKSTEETKAIMNDYTQQKLEAESNIHQKQFMAIDLFLDGARAQLKSLMEGPSKS